jgi:AraC family transcriptional regulator, regulatory protein of adaptative response / methylated-DNA-[protein]-cysteine methyltransferase
MDLRRETDLENQAPGPRSDEARMEAFLGRDASWDGLFFAAVTSTGIFCRPSCPARRPKPENVRFYDSARDALVAGFRPCRRCNPLEAPGPAPEWAAKLVAAVEDHPTRRLRDADLRAQGLDPAAVRRHFQKTYGMTFQSYSRLRRLGAAFTALSEGRELDEVVFSHGWGSHSGFRDAFAKATGGPPGRVGRPGGSGLGAITVAWVETPLGRLIAGATPEAICLLEFPDRRMIDTQLATVRRRYGLPLMPGESELLERLCVQLAEYFAGSRRAFDLPLDYPGTPFQRRVWDALLRIPYGETRSYSQLAAVIGEPGAARAVGHANGQNRIAIVIPCHRVIAADGGLGGYGGGLWRKLRLLEGEAPTPVAPASAEPRPV